LRTETTTEKERGHKGGWGEKEKDEFFLFVKELF